MPCEVCGHTVQNVGAEGQRIFWCPRCGTMLTEKGDFRTSEAPMLVQRVRTIRQCSANLNHPAQAFVCLAFAKDLWAAACEAVGLEV